MNVDAPRHMLLGEGDGVLRNDCLASRCVSCNKDRVTQFEMVDRLLLESVKFERVLRARHRGAWDIQTDQNSDRPCVQDLVQVCESSSLAC
jgi:hypothetical protein